MYGNMVQLSLTKVSLLCSHLRRPMGTVCTSKSPVPARRASGVGDLTILDSYGNRRRCALSYDLGTTQEILGNTNDTDNKSHEGPRTTFCPGGHRTFLKLVVLIDIY